jgi:hypothetical protein
MSSHSNVGHPSRSVSTRRISTTGSSTPANQRWPARNEGSSVASCREKVAASMLSF